LHPFGIVFGVLEDPQAGMRMGINESRRDYQTHGIDDPVRLAMDGMADLNDLIALDPYIRLEAGIPAPIDDLPVFDQ
jgi:hypothetical protein